MGWLHVVDSGKGVYLNRLISASMSYDDVERRLRFDGFGFLTPQFVRYLYPKPSFDAIDGYSRTGLALMIGAFADNPYGFYAWGVEDDKIASMDEESFLRLVDDGSMIDRCVVGCLAPLFSAERGYPQGAFRSLVDYNGDYMMFCTARIPLPDEWASLADLTESVYERRLAEFLGKVFAPFDVDIKLETCEEYVKE